MKEALVIVNPAARGGRAASDWLDVQRALEAEGVEFDAELTTRPHEAIELARRAVKDSRPLVVSAGGDGTLNEVVNGFFENGRALATETRLAMLPLGTGGDFRRTFDIPADRRAAARVLRAGVPRRIDAGRVTYRSSAGHVAERYFVNIADAGVGGEVMQRVNASGKRLGATATFTLAAMTSVLRYRNKWMRIVIDGRALEMVAQQVVVANGRYFGSGMKVAPFAQPDDGLFDVLVVGDVNLLDNVRGMISIRSGTHLDKTRAVYEYARARKVEVESPERLLIDVDGEQPGTAPASFEVIPSALTFMAPPPSSA